MAASQQILKEIRITRLKGLKNVAISLYDKPLIAIMGPNGCGKSTVIHALACVYNPVPPNVNYKFPHFFTPTTHSLWEGSKFSIIHNYRILQQTFTDIETEYQKDVDRWKPKYPTRIDRYFSFIGIRTCVPKIELENKTSRIRFNSTVLTDQNTTKVLRWARQILNRNYTSYNEHTTNRQKKYIGVSHNGIDYSSLSMGAGEQRLFYILSELVKAPRYGLMLIDEIDLLLHVDALKRLLCILNDVAIEKNLQIIFTSHSPIVTELDFISVKHLFHTSNATLCFTGTKPDALFRLTGEQQKTFEVFAEDKLAIAITRKVASDLGMVRDVSFNRFGSAGNCFTATAGAVLNNDVNLNNMLFVLDGDVYITEDEKKVQLSRAIVGDDEIFIEKRQEALSRIRQFILPVGQSPESYFHHLICRLEEISLTQEQREIQLAARQIEGIGDNHHYFSSIIDRLNLTEEVGLSKIVDMLRLTPEWQEITEQISAWFVERQGQVLEVA